MTIKKLLFHRKNFFVFHVTAKYEYQLLQLKRCTDLITHTRESEQLPTNTYWISFTSIQSRSVFISQNETEEYNVMYMADAYVKPNTQNSHSTYSAVELINITLITFKLRSCSLHTTARVKIECTTIWTHHLHKSNNSFTL